MMLFGIYSEAATGGQKLYLGRLGLERIISLIDPESAASEYVAEKVGLCFEKALCIQRENKARLCPE
jgi:RimJ/RimL family protein N-acetyltransferase